MSNLSGPNPARRLPALALGVALAIVVAAATLLSAGRPAHPVAYPRLANSSAPLGATIMPADVQSLAARVVPGLVNVVSVLGYQGAEAAGTGIVLTPNGEILTNNHVVEGATKITVTDLGNGRTYAGSVVGYDRTQDVAVIQLRGASGLATAALGNSATVAPGQPIAAVGNAGGTGRPSIAPGRVTGLNRSVTASDESSTSSEQLVGLIQIDADVVPGDSGGALVNSAGQVVGMDTAASAGYQLQTPFGGISIDTGAHQGFAIPINQAMAVARQITAGHGSAAVHVGPSAFVGVSIGNPPQGSGAQVVAVLPNSPAAHAGVPRGAVITAVDGRPVTSPTGLTNLMDTYRPGQQLHITWLAGAARHITTVVPVAGPVG